MQNDRLKYLKIGERFGNLKQYTLGEVICNFSKNSRRISLPILLPRANCIEFFKKSDWNFAVDSMEMKFVVKMLNV